MGDNSLFVLVIRYLEQKRRQRKNVGSRRNVRFERYRLPHTESRPNINLLIHLRDNKWIIQKTKAKKQNPEDFVSIDEHTHTNPENYKSALPLNKSNEYLMLEPAIPDLKGIPFKDWLNNPNEVLRFDEANFQLPSKYLFPQPLKTQSHGKLSSNQNDNTAEQSAHTAADRSIYRSDSWETIVSLHGENETIQHDSAHNDNAGGIVSGPDSYSVHSTPINDEQQDDPDSPSSVYSEENFEGVPF